jgi:Divergent InlB B-repeat domain
MLRSTRAGGRTRVLPACLFCAVLLVGVLCGAGAGSAKTSTDGGAPAVASQRAATAGDFLGDWRNVNPATGNQVRLLIDCESPVEYGAGRAAETCPDTWSLRVEAWGACVPTPCPWGPTYADASDARDGVVDITYRFSFKTETIRLTLLSDGRLRLDGHAVYNDGRATRDYTEFFATLSRARLIVTRSGTGSGTVVSDPTGIDCGVVCDTRFDAGTSVTLVGRPDAGSFFAGWSGACKGTGACTVTLDADVSVGARFEPRSHTLQVAKTGSGTVSSSPPGIACGSTCTASFGDGATVTLTATPTAGWAFSGWSGACSGKGTCTVMIDGDKTAGATFTQGRPTLSVTKTGSGAGSVSSSPNGIACGSSCAAVYDVGAVVTLIASPGDGSTFDGWSGACSGSGACTVALDGDRTVGATFTLARHTLTVARAGSGSGTVSSSPAGIDCGASCSAAYDHGTAVTLTASATGESIFVGWSGACSGTGGCTVGLDGDKAVTATFDPPLPKEPEIESGDDADQTPEIPPTSANPADRELVAAVAVGVTGNGVVTQESGRYLSRRAGTGLACGFNEFRCYTQVEPEQRIVLRARPLAGYRFVRWTGACAGQGPRCVIVARALKTVTAVFAPESGETVGFGVRPMSVRVKWNRSIGTGRVIVSGRIGGPARLVVRLRRPGGGPLLSRRLSVAGGRFRVQLPLRRGALARGAMVLPGGFVVSANGSSRGLALPFQLRPVVVPAPVEGVARLAFVSASEDGRPAGRLPAAAREAWVRFKLATQPSSNLPVTVAWYWPDGRLLGTAAKANRPEVITGITQSTGIQSGLWTAELRAGGRIVKRVAVRIG